MSKVSHRRVVAAVGAGLAITMTAAACGSSTKSAATPATGGSATTTPSGGSAGVLGPVNAATGTPVVFGLINDESPTGGSFPEARLGAQAAVTYVNKYRGGLDGHPIKLNTCITDGTASASENCANQLVADHPVAILGSTDLASGATLPIFAEAGLVEVGGIDLTPPMVTAPNSVVFNDVALAGTAAESAFIVQSLKAKKVGVIAIGDAQGVSVVNTFIDPVLKKLGAQVTDAQIPPSVADVTTGVASVVSASPDVYFVFSPSQCVSMFNALKSLGNTKPVVTIDPCSAPQVIQATSGAVANAYFSSPYLPPTSTKPDAILYNAIVTDFAPPTMARDSTSQAGVQTVMNLWSAFHSTPISQLTSTYMLSTLKAGSQHPNFLSSPYTCDGTAAPPFPGLCDAVQYMHQITPAGTVVQPTDQEWAGLQYLSH